MVMVKRQRDETDEKMIKRFIKKMKKSSIMEEILKRRFYVKPSVKKRMKKKKQIADYKRRMQKEKK